MSYPLQQLSPNGGGGWTSMPLPMEMISNFDDIDMELDFYNMFSSENEVQMFQFLPPDDTSNNNSNSEFKPSSSWDLRLVNVKTEKDCCIRLHL